MGHSAGEVAVSAEETPLPAVGQVWVDNDPRIREDRGCDRFIRIREIDQPGIAVCDSWYEDAPTKIRTARIKLSRFTPGRTGYRFVEGPAPAAAETVAVEITDEMIERAARELAVTPWDRAPEDLRNAIRHQARRVLEAAFGEGAAP